MWVNGEKTQCWPQELFIVKLNDDDGFSFQDDEYGDDDHEDNDIDNHEDYDVPVDHDDYVECADFVECTNYVDYDDNSDDDFIVVDDVASEDWMSITSCGSSKLVLFLNFIQYF